MTTRGGEVENLEEECIHEQGGVEDELLEMTGGRRQPSSRNMADFKHGSGTTTRYPAREQSQDHRVEHKSHSTRQKEVAVAGEESGAMQRTLISTLVNESS